MTIGIALQRERKEVSIRFSEKLNKLWVGTEIVLFVLVGATIDVSLIAKAGLVSVILLLGVLIYLMKTDLNKKNVFFCALAYTPKATV